MDPDGDREIRGIFYASRSHDIQIEAVLRLGVSDLIGAIAKAVGGVLDSFVSSTPRRVQLFRQRESLGWLRRRRSQYDEQLSRTMSDLSIGHAKEEILVILRTINARVGAILD